MTDIIPIESKIETCRICLDDDDITNMISPCLCRGTSKYVHPFCINQWREMTTNPNARHQCLECNSDYAVQPVNEFFHTRVFRNHDIDKMIIQKHLFVWSLSILLSFFILGDKIMFFTMFELISILFYCFVSLYSIYVWCVTNKCTCEKCCECFSYLVGILFWCALILFLCSMNFEYFEIFNLSL